MAARRWRLRSGQTQTEIGRRAPGSEGTDRSGKSTPSSGDGDRARSRPDVAAGLQTPTVVCRPPLPQGPCSRRVQQDAINAGIDRHRSHLRSRFRLHFQLDRFGARPEWRSRLSNACQREGWSFTSTPSPASTVVGGTAAVNLMAYFSSTQPWRGPARPGCGHPVPATAHKGMGQGHGARTTAGAGSALHALHIRIRPAGFSPVHPPPRPGETCSAIRL